MVSLRRLQALECLSLGIFGHACGESYSSTQRILQTVDACCLKLRKLAVDFRSWGRMPKDELTNIATIFVKFEEIDLTYEDVWSFEEETVERSIKAILGAILGALHGDSPKLKILTMLTRNR